MNLTNVIKSGKAPFTENPPAGAYLLYDPKFINLEEEIKKSGSINGGSTDWKKVVQLSLELLENSKDILIVSYLTIAVFKTSGLNELSRPLLLYRDIITTFWKELFPQKKRRRMNSVSWLLENLSKELTSESCHNHTTESINKTHQLLNEISDFLQKKEGEEAPSFREVISLTKKIIGKSQSKSKEIPKNKEHAPSLPSKSLPAFERIESEADKAKAIKHCENVVKKIAAFMRISKLSSSLPYTLLRSITWRTPAAIPATKTGVTQITGYRKEVKESLKQLVEKSEWKSLIETVESRFSEFPFWLDLQRYLIVAADGLGEEYRGMKEAVSTETTHFLRKNPNLIHLKFKNGEPFADGKTQFWIDSELLLDKDSEAEHSNKAVQDGATENSKTVLDKIKKSFSLDKIEEAVDTFQKELRGISPVRKRFLWRLEFAKLCVQAKQYQLALPMLHLLDKEIKEFSLEQWEPELTVVVLSLLYSTEAFLLKKGKNPDPSNHEKLERLQNRLYFLDISEACKTNGFLKSNTEKGARQ